MWELPYKSTFLIKIQLWIVRMKTCIIMLQCIVCQKSFLTLWQYLIISMKDTMNKKSWNVLLLMYFYDDLYSSELCKIQAINVGNYIFAETVDFKTFRGACIPTHALYRAFKTLQCTGWKYYLLIIKLNERSSAWLKVFWP